MIGHRKAEQATRKNRLQTKEEKQAEADSREAQGQAGAQEPIPLIVGREGGPCHGCCWLQIPAAFEVSRVGGTGNSLDLLRDPQATYFWALSPPRYDTCLPIFWFS